VNAPAQPAPLAIGVALAPRFERRGDSLADARAFEAAGCDSLWLEGDEDPWLAAAAIAVVTARARVVVPVTRAELPFLASRTATLGRLLGGRRLVLCCPVALFPMVRGAAPIPVFCTEAGLAGAPADAEGLVVPLSALPADAAGAAPGAIWLRCDAPADRNAWREVRSRCRTLGAAGAVVPETPRLLDLLRNPDRDDDRSDLFLAHG
jgi:hypothetical protein